MPSWSKGDIPGPQWDCIFVDIGNSEDMGICGLLVAQVHLFFRFSHNGLNYPCALVHWYSTSNEPDPTTSFWVVQLEFVGQCRRHMGVIHLNSVIQVAHLLLKFPSNAPVYQEINYMNVPDLYSFFYINKFINHHAFKIAF